MVVSQSHLQLLWTVFLIFSMEVFVGWSCYSLNFGLQFSEFGKETHVESGVLLINYPISVLYNQVDHEVTCCIDVKKSVSEMAQVNFGVSCWISQV